MKTLPLLFRRPASAVSTSILLLFVSIAIMGPLIAPFNETQISAERFQAPSEKHWFGTDHLGRDVFSRVLIGTRSILLVAGTGTLFALLLGLTLGLISGFKGGWFDEVLMRSFDSLLSIPAILLALLLLGTIGHSQSNILIVLATVYTPIVARVVRSEVLSIKTKGFVEAARLQGEKPAFILFREILPSVLPAISVEAAMRFTYAIFLVASLGFLGVGVQPPTPDWGLMVKESRDYASLYPWMLLYPALAISILVIATNLTADGLKNVLQRVSVGSITMRKFAKFKALRGNSTPPLTLEASDAQVAIKNLSVAYEHSGIKSDTVRNVSLDVECGQTMGLVGESGSGKTTLAMALMQTLDLNGKITTGEIQFGGRNLLELSPKELRNIWGREMKLVPQDPLAALNPSIRVGEQIAEALRYHMRLSRAEAARRAIALLGDVQVADPERVARSYPHQLSGGMQQRVMIAMALGTSPRLLVLDEPTTGLDVTTAATVLDLFKNLIKAHGASAIYISHDLGVVQKMADRVAVMYAGEVVEEAQTQNLYEQPLHPYTQGLLRSVPRLGEGKGSGHLISMEGQIPSLQSLPKGCVFEPRCPWAMELCREVKPQLESLDQQSTIRKIRCHRWQEIAEQASSSKRESTEKANPTPTILTDSLQPILEVKNLKKSFQLRRSPSELLSGHPRKAIHAVEDVNLQIKQGKIVGLVGESGSGKSTLARVIMGLAQPTAGEIRLGEITLSERLRDRRFEALKRLQMVFQNPQDALNPYRTVGQTLNRTVRRFSECTRDEANRAVSKLLEQVKLDPGYTDRLPAQLSGGEKQRIAIARALASGSEIILYDEPTSALDVSVQAGILNLLGDLQIKKGISALFISHDLAVVGFLADEIAVIYLGELMEVRMRDSFFETPYHPYTEALISAMPRLDSSANEKVIRLKGEIPSPTDRPTGCPFHTRCPRFLGDICVNERPPWQMDEHGNRIFCHIPIEELSKIQEHLIVNGLRDL